MAEDGRGEPLDFFEEDVDAGVGSVDDVGAGEDEVDKKKPSRTSAQWTTPVVVVALLVLVPLLINAVVPAGAVGWTVVGFVAVTSFLGGFVDAIAYRFNVSIVGVCCAAFFVTMLMYYNSGTWIYLIVVALLSFCGAFFGDKDGAEAEFEEAS